MPLSNIGNASATPKTPENIVPLSLRTVFKRIYFCLIFQNIQNQNYRLPDNVFNGASNSSKIFKSSLLKLLGPQQTLLESCPRRSETHFGRATLSYVWHESRQGQVENTFCTTWLSWSVFLNKEQQHLHYCC